MKDFKPVRRAVGEQTAGERTTVIEVKKTEYSMQRAIRPLPGCDAPGLTPFARVADPLSPGDARKRDQHGHGEDL